MILFLVFLGLAALIGIIGTLVSLRRDGYRRVPTRPEAVWVRAGTAAPAPLAAAAPPASASLAVAAPIPLPTVGPPALGPYDGVPQRHPRVRSDLRPERVGQSISAAGRCPR